MPSNGKLNLDNNIFTLHSPLSTLKILFPKIRKKIAAASLEAKQRRKNY
ncbi:MAG: hypothetical protein ACI4RP_02750 [Acutalibacteraceae bacterium]